MVTYLFKNTDVQAETSFLFHFMADNKPRKLT